MTTIYLVRHAHADWTPDESRPLSARGEADALRLADLLEREPIAAVYASTSRRARDSTAPLAARKGLQVRELQDLRERELAAQPVGDLHFMDAVRATWDDPMFAWPGGETNQAAQQRGAAVVQEIVAGHPHEQIVVGTHGNLLALILQHYDPSIGFAFWQRLTMPDVYRLSFAPDGAPAIQRWWSD